MSFRVEMIVVISVMIVISSAVAFSAEKPPASGEASDQKTVLASTTAIKGSVTDSTGETYGVAGISNSPDGAGLGAANTNGGADLVLDGSADGESDAVLTQAGLDRPSASITAFTFHNSGTGILDLYVDGTLYGNGSGLTFVDAALFGGSTVEEFPLNVELAVSGLSSIHWGNLTNLPVGLADGDDDTLDDLACATDEIARWTGSAWNCTADSNPLPVLNNTIYVAINGSSTGPGTVEEPYDTAQNGYDAAATAYPGVSSTVVLMGGGSYGALNMHAGTVSVLGQARSELADLTVSAGIPSPPFPASTFPGKQRVENVIVIGQATVLPNGLGAWVKFHNCRFLDGLTIDESYVEVQDCAIQLANKGIPAVTVGPTGAPITEIGFYQSSIFANDSQTSPPGALPGVLTVLPSVLDFEVIGCQIVNEGATMGGAAPAIQDLSPPIPPPRPLHFYSHNVIKGPTTGMGRPAVADFMIGVPQPAGSTIVFTHNTVYGDVGAGAGVGMAAGTPQYFANNTIYGVINFTGSGAVVGWVQAGAGPGLDGAGNTEHPVGWGTGGFTLPSHWDD